MLIYKNENILVDKIDNFYILFNKDNDKIFELNQIGYLLWESIVDGADLNILCQVICKYIEDTPTNFIDEVLDFMNQLKESGMIKLVNDVKGVSLAHITSNIIKKIINEQGYYKFKYHGSSMTSMFKQQQIILIEKFDPEKISIGDIVVFSSYKHTDLIIHRVDEITASEDGKLIIITKGDNNEDVDDITPIELFVGKAYVPQKLTREKPKLLEDITVREENDKAIIYSYSTGTMKILNEIGTILVNYMDGTHQVVELMELLLESIDEIPDYNTVLSDIEQFIVDLKSEGYIVYE